MRTLKEIVKQYSLDNDFHDTDDAGLFETFEEFFDIVWQGEGERPRWYTDYDVVYQVDDNGVPRHFQYYVRDVHGDGCRDDTGWEPPDLDDIVEVFPKTVSTTIYVTKDKV